MIKNSFFMKYLVCLICFLTIGLSSSVQAYTWDIQKIRTRYAQVKAKINENVNGYNGGNRATLTMEHTLPGTGKQKVNYTLYFTPYSSTGDGYLLDHKLEVVEASYNIAAQQFYEEYLFDDNGQIIFIYGRRPDTEQNGWIETRWYFNQFQVLKSSITKKIDGQSTELPAETNPDYYFEDTMWKAQSILNAAGCIFATVNHEYKESGRYNSAYGNDNFDIHGYLLEKMEDDILNIPGAAKYSVMLTSDPSDEESFYTFRLGENMQDHFTTLHWFHVYPFSTNMKGTEFKTHKDIIGRYYVIKVYDVATDSEMPIDEWLQTHGEIK